MTDTYWVNHTVRLGRCTAVPCGTLTEVNQLADIFARRTARLRKLWLISTVK